MRTARKLRINEISAVDKPAHKGARVTISKNAQPKRYHIPDDALDSISAKLTEIYERAGMDGASVIAAITAAWAKAYPTKAPIDLPDEEEPEPAPASTPKPNPAVKRKRFHLAKEHDDMTTKAEATATAKRLIAAEKDAKKSEDFAKAVDKRAAEYLEQGVRNASTAAMQELRDEDPDGFAAFQAFGDYIERGDDIQQAAEQDDYVTKGADLDTKVNKAVADILNRDDCDHRTAMQRAQSENPKLFADWNNS